MGFVSELKERIKRIWFRKMNFRSTKKYWNRRYLEGGNSGSGSYGHLAEFKANILNDFVKSHKVETVIEYGCGDGNQLMYMKYPQYVGFDISPIAVEICRKKFGNDSSKVFRLMTEYDNHQADLTLSLEVVFHLIEDDVFFNYMNILFSSSRRFVIIYSSNTNKNEERQAVHVKHRRFTDWVVKNAIPFELVKKIDNHFPFDGSNSSSFSDFYIFERKF